MAWPEADDLMLGLVVRARTEKEGPGNGVPPWFEGALLALEAVGALSAAEAAEWRARVERDAADRDVGDHDLASDTTRRRAGEMLEALLVPARSRRTREANEERFETLLAACEVARVFSPPEIEGWLERLSDARGVRGPAQAREELPSAAKLLAVVPGSQPGEGELHVRWVELYSDAVVVHWLETVDLGSEPPARGEERLMRDTRGFELADDRGGSFASDGTKAELRRLGTRRALAGRSRFSPGVTPGAEQLELRNSYTGERVSSIRCRYERRRGRSCGASRRAPSRVRARGLSPHARIRIRAAAARGPQARLGPPRPFRAGRAADPHGGRRPRLVGSCGTGVGDPPSPQAAP